MVLPKDVEAVIRRMAEARDEALWKVLLEERAKAFTSSASDAAGSSQLRRPSG